MIGIRFGVVDRSLAATLAILPALPLAEVPSYLSSPFVDQTESGMHMYCYVYCTEVVKKQEEVMQAAIDEYDTRRIKVANMAADEFAWKLRVTPFWYSVCVTSIMCHTTAIDFSQVVQERCC